MCPKCKNMCPDNSDVKPGEDTSTFKQRFKGVERFLRKIAFNLGNSPSQTEVKIISCIPIDVTDLQSKIISLERQLLEAKTVAQASAKPTAVNTALIEPARPHATVMSCECSEMKPLSIEKTTNMCSECCGGSSKSRKSTVSFSFPNTSNDCLCKNQPFPENWVEKEAIDNSIHRHRKRFFRKCKKNKTVKKKEKCKTHLVYYAQTQSNPFTNYGISTDIPYMDYLQPKIKNTLSKSYLANVIRRHFDPGRAVEEFSDTSHFTSPVCRDYHSRGHCPYDSDICSCCHGRFQNIDKYFGKNKNFIVEPAATRSENEFNKNIYYDSNLYDMVPVKDQPTKVTKEEKLSVMEPRCPIDMQCWPESTRAKSPRHRTGPHYQTKIHTKSKNTRKPTCEDAKDDVQLKTQKVYRPNKINTKTRPMETSKNVCIDCSEVYPKPRLVTHQSTNPETAPKRAAFRKNAECLTVDADVKNQTITRSVQIDINSTETKTEETLNQIKSILQSVLTEVKTNPQVNQLREETSKKDVVIQKTSQSNMQACSSLLHSFTYNNSCNINPHLPTCSRQIAKSFYASAPYQCLDCTQNFPLFIQTPGYPKCGCFYKHSSHKRTVPQKQAASTATNTELSNRDTQSGETEKLIKEIYKSIALTLESPKETSNSDYGCKYGKNNYIDEPSLKRDTITKASVTNSSTTVRSNNRTIAVDFKPTKQKVEVDHEILGAEEFSKGKANVTSINEHYSKELTTNAKSLEVTEKINNAKNKMEKRSLLQRVFDSIKLFDKIREKTRKERTNRDMARRVDGGKAESDSDDYQTICSEKMNMPHRGYNRRRQYKPKGYVTYRPAQEKAAQRKRRNRRSPCMEQEFRRKWDEELMFRENRGRRYSLEGSYSYRKAPVYWQNYEAWSAVEDRVPSRPTYSPVLCSPVKIVSRKVEQKTSPMHVANAKCKFSWLKKRKRELSQCGERWKKFVLEI